MVLGPMTSLSPPALPSLALERSPRRSRKRQSTPHRRHLCTTSWHLPLVPPSPSLSLPGGSTEGCRYLASLRGKNVGWRACARGRPSFLLKRHPFSRPAHPEAATLPSRTSEEATARKCCTPHFLIEKSFILIPNRANHAGCYAQECRPPEHT